MSAAISPATAQSYGVQRVCRIRDLPRSRRGPVPPVAEEAVSWPRSKRALRPRRSVARGTAKSRLGCGMASAWWSAATGCCG
jgi:hypothetical protein